MPVRDAGREGSAGKVWLKLENLQPIGSFKPRGAVNAMRLAGPEGLRDGVYIDAAKLCGILEGGCRKGAERDAPGPVSPSSFGTP